MLFDYIAFVDTNPAGTRPGASPLDSLDIKNPNPFNALEHYTNLSYHLQESATEHTQVISLHKHPDESYSVYRDDTLEVYIFGYCFTRLDSERFPEKSRLSAQRVAQCYQEWGTGFLSDIKGSFAILILEKATRTVHVFTDPLNVRPVYYYHEGTHLVVSTALNALLRHRQAQSLPTEINPVALIEYYLFEYPLNDDTYVRSVQTVPAGGWLRFSNEGLRVKAYWNVFEQLNNFSIAYRGSVAVDTLEKLLKKNLALYLSDPARTAVALTGGYDSRTNLALLGEAAQDYLLYSYGTAGTYDLSIPQEIAQSLGLNYRAFHLDERYRRDFDENARLAIDLGDGLAEANRGNYLYVFKQLGQDYDYILTGLFGSELIKHPTSVGNFINQATKQLLEADDPARQVGAMLHRAATDGYLDAEAVRAHGDELKQRVLANPYIVNDHPLPVKYFYYLLMVGIRKYFMKEIKVERPYVENLHPFFDLEFIETLLQTPFPWVHHWEGKKNLIKSIETHKFYVSMIHRNQPELANILSTHAYTPRYLLHRLSLPVLALQYLYYKRKIRAKENFKSSAPVLDYLMRHPPTDNSYGILNPEKLQPTATDTKNVIKLASLQRWLDSNLTEPTTHDHP